MNLSRTLRNGNWRSVWCRRGGRDHSLVFVVKRINIICLINDHTNAEYIRIVLSSRVDGGWREMTGREAKAVTGGTHSPNRPGFPIVE
jgi:hypothetical protein